MENYLDSAPCIYYCYTDEGKISCVNDTICELLGYTREELVGKPAEVLFTVATRIFQQTHFFPLLKMHGHAEEIFLTLLGKNQQQVPVLINAERKKINGENLYVHIGIVVHNRKKFEDELVAAKKAAESALNENQVLTELRERLQKQIEEHDRQIHVVNKQNEELRQFSRVVTHDLQEPLRKLFLFVNMLLGTDESEKIVPIKIKKVSEQMRSTLSGLQQYVWLTDTSNKVEDVDLKQVIKKVQHELTGEHPSADFALETEELPQLQADGNQMHLLFYHLLANTIRFRKPDHQLNVYISAATLRQNRFRNFENKYKYEDVVKLQIADNGMGFDNEYKNQVFELFKRLHSESGQGVGLALCKKIVDHHHGHISIHSKKGEGTTVTVVLPLKQVDQLTEEKQMINT